MQAIATASREQRFCTKHETRNTNHGFSGTEALQSFFSVGGRVRLRVMTPLWGTKTPSVPVGARSDGDGRAARSQLSCALWSGMGGYGAAWAATAPRAGNTAFMLFTNHNFPTHHFPRFPTISHDFPAFPGPPPPPPPIKCPRAVRLSWSAARTAAPCRAARSLLSCALWRGMGRLWRGMGGGSPPHGQHGLSCSPAVRYFFWSEPGPPTMVFTKHETRDTNHGFYAFHETRNTAFSSRAAAVG